MPQLYSRDRNKPVTTIQRLKQRKRGKNPYTNISNRPFDTSDQVKQAQRYWTAGDPQPTLEKGRLAWGNITIQRKDIREGLKKNGTSSARSRVSQGPLLVHSVKCFRYLKNPLQD